MPFTSEGRTLLRTIALGGALVGTLAAASPANAALGGVPAAKFANRPNLQSVTFQGTVATFKFDRSLTTVSNTNLFKLQAYRAGVFVGGPGGNGATTAVVSSSDPTVVLATFGNRGGQDDVTDFNAITDGLVGPGAVTGAGNAAAANPNLADATSVTTPGMSASESGTRGHTTGPDLQSVAVDANRDIITYTFDQRVSERNSPPTADNFGFLQDEGTVFNGAPGQTVTVNGADVEVQFARGSVTRARQAFVTGGLMGQGAAAAPRAGAPRAAATNPAFNFVGPPAASVPVPGQGNGSSRGPVLQSTELDGLGGTLVYTFDQTVANNPSPTAFHAVTSNGSTVAGSQAQAQGNTVRVTFNAQQFIEHVVYASVNAGAVTNQNGTASGAPFGKPAGGNQGAKSSGFTTAPDVLSATVNPNGQVSVLFDSRIRTVDPDGFQLLDQNGDKVNAQPPGVVSVRQNNGQPDQARVVLQFPQDAVANGVSTAIRVVGNRVKPDGSGDASTPAVIGTIPDNVFGGDNQDVQTLVPLTPTTTSFKKK